MNRNNRNQSCNKASPDRFVKPKPLSRRRQEIREKAFQRCLEAGLNCWLCQQYVLKCYCRSPTFDAFLNLWLMMLYKKGLIHVDKKYVIPDMYVSVM